MRLVTIAVVVLPILSWVIAGLDFRFGWTSPLPAWAIALGVIIGLIAQFFVLWAMASNPFFSATVRIQSERRQHVISGGPYRNVRHPGYAGTILGLIVAPLVRGSWWCSSRAWLQSCCWRTVRS